MNAELAAHLTTADAPVGPSPDEEMAFLATEPKTAPANLAEVGRSVRATPDETPLPPMEDLVQQIPVGTRAALEELFRARFITVRRFPESALK